MTRVVPYPGLVKVAQTGKIPLALKRALSKAGFIKWGSFTPVWGVFAVQSLKNFQTKHGIQPTGLYGRPTHEKLAPFFDAYGVWLLAQAKPPVPELDARRKRILAAATIAYNNRAHWHYTQGSNRMMTVRLKLKAADLGNRSIYEDCSSGATGLYFVAGAPDPNGRGFDGFGYTGTLCWHGAMVSLAAAKPGDLVFYGSGAPYSHVAVYIGEQRVWSHGSENGPYVLPIDYRRDRREIRSYLP